jgi:hypothetical protein
VATIQDRRMRPALTASGPPAHGRRRHHLSRADGWFVGAA